MNRFLIALFAIHSLTCDGQTSKNINEEELIKRILAEPSHHEINEVLTQLQQKDLSPKEVVIHDSVILLNKNRLYILSHQVEGKRHYGAIVIPGDGPRSKLPVIIMATGGDGMHVQFDMAQDFNHGAVQFPEFLGGTLDQEFVIVIPSFRGQQLIMGDRKYQSEGKVGDAFEGATTDAIAFLNVALKTFPVTDDRRIAICGGSRGGTVALLASSRDRRINRAIVIAAPTDMKALYLLYPDQFKLLFFNDLLAGKITEEDARKKFISSSPFYFIDEFPKVQLHHDRNDPFVPVEFASRFVDKMTMQGKEIDDYYYDEGIHGFWTDKKFWSRVQDFVRQLRNE